MISELTIGNFKAFGPPQRIPLRPITLIFGPNSAGKSSIIQSLLLARHIHDTGKVDAHQTTLGGAAVDLGGFGKYVRNHDSRLETVIEFCVPRSAISAQLHELDKFEMLRISYRIRKADSAQGGSNPAIASVALRLDGNELVSLERSDVGELQIDVSAIDSPHWVARYGHQYGYQLRVLELLEESFESLDTKKRDLFIKWAKEEVENAVQELSQMKFAAAFLALENRSPLSREYPDYDVFGTDADFDRPDRDPFGFYERELKRENDEQEPSSSEVWARAFRYSLECLIDGVNDAIRGALSALSYLGPLRWTPPRLIPDGEQFDASWAAGGGDAWQRLRREPNLLERVNHFLRDSLRTRYRLECQHFARVASTGSPAGNSPDPRSARVAEDRRQPPSAREAPTKPSRHSPSSKQTRASPFHTAMWAQASASCCLCLSTPRARRSA
jgi:hypothetical protein